MTPACTAKLRKTNPSRDQPSGILMYWEAAVSAESVHGRNASFLAVPSVKCCFRCSLCREVGFFGKCRFPGSPSPSLTGSRMCLQRI